MIDFLTITIPVDLAEDDPEDVARLAADSARFEMRRRLDAGHEKTPGQPEG